MLQFASERHRNHSYRRLYVLAPKRASELIADNRIREARELMERTIAVENPPPGDVRSLCRTQLGQCYELEGRWEDALFQYRCAITYFSSTTRSGNLSQQRSDNSSTEAMLYEKIAICLYRIGDADNSADDMLRHCAERYAQAGNKGRYHLQSGFLLLNASDFPGAIAAFREAVHCLAEQRASAPFRQEALFWLARTLDLSGWCSTGRKHFVEALELSDSERYSPGLLCSAAINAARIGLAEEAMELIQRDTQIVGETGENRLSLAHVLFLDGHLQKALDEVIAIQHRGEPHLIAPAFALEAEILFAAGNFDDGLSALQAADDASRLQMRSANGNEGLDHGYDLLRAVALVKMKRDEDALQVLDRLRISASPARSAHAHALQLLARKRGGRVSIEEVVDLLDCIEKRIAEFDVQNDGVVYFAGALSILGETLREFGQFVRAAMVFQQLTSASRTTLHSAYYPYQLGRCYELDDDLLEARSAYETATSAGTESIYVQLARVRLASLDVESAMIWPARRSREKLSRKIA